VTPSTIVRRPRGPFTFIGLSSFFQEAKEERSEKAIEHFHNARRAVEHKCIVYLDDGRLCNLPAHCIDLQRGGFVCDEHRPVYRQKICGV
jgi:hypothetical protein